MKDYARLHRKDYKAPALKVVKMDRDPIRQFLKWFNEAESVGIEEPNSMALATATKSGAPSVRYLLIKQVDKEGFSFFTNYRSRKGKELFQNPRAAASVYWAPLSRQVRIEGRVVRLSESDSDAYFATRPKGAQIAAWSSPQSKRVLSREVLLEAVIKYREKFGRSVVPRPPHWGGYKLIPTRIEFWQGQRDRLHDRVVYVKRRSGWQRERLAP